MSHTEFRVTRQRRIILDEIRAMGTHPTACELYDAVRRKLPRISLATVYRNLEILAEKGLVGKILTDGGKRFDGNMEAHYHARCLGCGRVMDIVAGGEIVSLLRRGLGDPECFRICDAHIELRGYCRNCSAGEGGYKDRGQPEGSPGQK